MLTTSCLPSPLKSPVTTDTVDGQHGPVAKVVGVGKARGKVCACTGTSNPAVITTAKSVRIARALVRRQFPWEKVDRIFSSPESGQLFSLVLREWLSTSAEDFGVRGCFRQWTQDSRWLVRG